MTSQPIFSASHPERLPLLFSSSSYIFYFIFSFQKILIVIGFILHLQLPKVGRGSRKRKADLLTPPDSPRSATPEPAGSAKKAKRVSTPASTSKEKRLSTSASPGPAKVQKKAPRGKRKQGGKKGKQAVSQNAAKGTLSPVKVAASPLHKNTPSKSPKTGKLMQNCKEFSKTVWTVSDFFFVFDVLLRGAWRDRDTNDIFAHCSLIFYFLDFKFSHFVCPSVLHRLIWFFLKNSFRKKKNIRKTTQNALAPSIFIILSIALKLGTPLLHTQAQNTSLQNF